MEKQFVDSYESTRMHNGLLGAKAVLDAMSNGTITVHEDSAEVFDPETHSYTITTILAVIRNNVYAGLGEPLPSVGEWGQQFPIIKE